MHCRDAPKDCNNENVSWHPKHAHVHEFDFKILQVPTVGKWPNLYAIKIVLFVSELRICEWTHCTSISVWG